MSISSFTEMAAILSIRVMKFYHKTLFDKNKYVNVFYTAFDFSFLFLVFDRVFSLSFFT